MYDISFSTNMHYILPIFPTKYFTPTTSYICRESIYITLINTDFHLLFISFSYYTMDRSYYTKIKGWKLMLQENTENENFHINSLCYLLHFCVNKNGLLLCFCFYKLLLYILLFFSPFGKYLSGSFLSFTMILYLY